MRSRNNTVAAAERHFQHTAGKVAQVVGEFGVVTIDKRFLRKAGIGTGRHRRQQIVTERIHTRQFDHIHGIDDVAERFAHLGLAGEPPAVGKNGFGQRQVHSFEHRGPVNGMGGQNIFADKLAAGGPPLGKLFIILQIAHAGKVVQQSIKPDIADVIFVKRQFNTPGHTFFGAGNTQIAQFLTQEAQRFVGTELGQDEVGVGFDIFNEPLLIIFHPEKVVGLHDLGHFAAAFGAFAFHQVFFGEKAFIAHAVPAHIFGLVDQIAVIKIL